MNFRHSKWTSVTAVVAVIASVGGFGLAQAASDSENVLTSIDPCRLADSRTASNVGPLAAPLGPGQTATFTAIGDNGNCVGIPADVEVVEVQLTSVGATVDTFWTAYPSDLAERPDVSQLNPRVELATTSNSTMVTLSDTGEFSLYNAAGSSDVVIDVLGYFSPGAAGPEGPAGPQGPVGAQGDQGVQGDQGDQGDQGVQGDQGDQGVQGVQGDPGLAAVEIVNGITSASNTSGKTVIAACPVGKVALGGGFEVGGSGTPVILRSLPTSATEWTAESTGTIFGTFTLTAHVICASVAGP